MGDRTGIAWTDATWNPLRGCSRVSEGCRNCYAERVASRFSGPGLPYEGLARDGRWTGEVRLVEEHLADPLRWKRPRRIFVNSMSDLFHERVPDEWIDRIFAVMALAPHHTFQILTKRPERMWTYLAGWPRGCAVGTAIHNVSGQAGGLGDPASASMRLSGAPLPNVWLGVSVEDQATADARVPLLLQTPAAVRFVSYEPALGPVDWRPSWLAGYDYDGRGCSLRSAPRLDWIIVGGESGPGARPFDVAWARQTVAACRAAGVACFVKQLGARPFWCDPNARSEYDVGGGEFELRHRAGADPAEWPEDLRVREFPAVLRGRAR